MAFLLPSRRRHRCRPTHEVINQPPPLTATTSPTTRRCWTACAGEGAGWVEPSCATLGRLAGTEQAQEWGRLANENPPVLRTHDRFGHRIDEVEFHPAWHELMTVAVGAGLHAAPWGDPRPGAHVARAAGLYVWGKAEGGHGCPISMTYAAVPALRHAPELAAPVRAAARPAGSTTPGPRPAAAKRGLLAGMAMTEKQGGSDVRANTTGRDAGGRRQLPADRPQVVHLGPDVRRVPGARPGARRGLGAACFLLPRVLPDGTRNTLRIQRLKDKLGNRSNASAELEYDDAAGLAGRRGGPRRPRPSSRWST